LFFHSDLFTDLGIDADSANFITKVCNQFIDQNSQNVYGEYLQNGKASGFSTEKKRTDSHTALLLGVTLMGSLKPHDATVKLDTPTKQDIERFQAQRIQQLEREVSTLRGG
jgi:hypothetical protein